MSNMEDLCDPSRSSILEIKRGNRLSNIQDRVHEMLVCSLNIVKGKVGQQEIIGSLSSQLLLGGNRSFNCLIVLRS